MSDKKVKLKFISNAGSYQAGKVHEVPEHEVDALCAIRKKNADGKVVEFRVAMTEDEFEKLKKLPVDKGGLTKDEAKALGAENKVETPKGPIAPHLQNEPKKAEPAKAEPAKVEPAKAEPPKK